MPTALVTGANGFIGSHLVPALLKRGYTVRCLVRKTSDIRPLAGLPVSLVVGDLRERATLDPAVAGVDYVFHCAAALLVTTEGEFDQTNRQGTINLLDAVEANRAPEFKRFVFVSSQIAAGPADSSEPIDETREMRPISWYGKSKQAAEEHVIARHKASGVPVTVVRPPAVYGERERDIAQLFGAVESRIHPILGWQTKHLVTVYVGDLVEGMIAAAESEVANGQRYFLNHPKVYTAKSMVKTVARAVDKPFGVSIPVPIPLFAVLAPVAELAVQFTRARPPTTRDKVREMGVKNWVASPAKAKRDFGWEAKTELVDGMAQTIRYWRTGEDELRKMPLEKGVRSWLKFLVVGLILGCLIEITAALGKFYTFDPGWLALPVIFVGFSFALGSVAMITRAWHPILQFVLGTAVTGSAELANALGILPGVSWTFAPGWPFGITDPYLRVAVTGAAGGIFVLIVNAIMRSFYRRRQRLG